MSLATDGVVETIFAAASDPSTARSAAFRSTDRGSTWTLLTETLPGETAQVIAADPRDASRVFAATVRNPGESSATRIYRSEDSGTSWASIGDFDGCGASFAFHPGNTSFAYFSLACTGAFFSSEDAGRTWTKRSDGAPNKLAVSADGTIYGTAQDGSAVLRSVDGGLHWSSLPPTCTDPFLLIQALALDATGRPVVGTGHVRMIFIDCPGLFRFSGSGWETLSEFAVRALAFDPQDPSRIYALRIFGTALFVSMDGGETWGSLPLELDVSELAVSASGGLYAAGAGGAVRVSIPLTRLVAPR